MENLALGDGHDPGAGSDPRAGGGGRIGFVAVSDVAAVAAQALTDGDPPDIKAITGPEALDYADVAARVSTVFARQVDYADIPAEEARSMMLDDGVLLPALWSTG